MTIGKTKMLNVHWTNPLFNKDINCKQARIAYLARPILVMGTPNCGDIRIKQFIA